ncbi:MAG: hypothetical protein NUV54_02865 [Candidatus Taylorbacteria bacterium]|nr:hypothetical protein [Candidatus Taylorbacteria bacterium]
MHSFLHKNEKLVSVAIISFAIGFGLSFLLLRLYQNKEIVGNFCLRTAEQAKNYFTQLP